jgi:hypothetical protein
MNTKTTILAALAAASLLLTARPARASDVSVEVNEAVLQHFFTALGPVGMSGGDSKDVRYPYPDVCWAGPFPYPCVKWGTCQAAYTWNVQVSSMTAHIVAGAIPFTGQAHADASAGICGITVRASYSPAFNGALGASWASAEEEVRLAMQHLNVEIYVSFLGQHLTLTSVDVASKLPSPLYRQKVDLAQKFTLPAPIGKEVRVNVQNPALQLLPAKLRLSADLVFTVVPVPSA